MKTLLAASLTAALAISGGTAANAAVVLGSTFDGSTGAVTRPGVNSVSLGGYTDAPELTVTYTGNAAASGSVLTALARLNGSGDLVGGGFVYTTDADFASQDVATLNDNLNAADKAVGRGYSLTFTADADYDLSKLTVLAGHLEGAGNDQAFLSDVNVSITDAGGTVYSNSVLQHNFNAAEVWETFMFDLTGASLVNGTLYTLTVTQNNLPAGGAYATYDGFTLESVPEPGSLALLGLGGLAIMARRRRA